jgi:ABC-type Fe3+ transport system substrate-binding protein
MNKQLVFSIAVWLGLLALPFALRQEEPGGATAPADADRLVIISAHNKAARDEYARAFGEYYYQKHGRRIELDFRNVGGTSAISKYLNDRFEAEFRVYYEKKHPGEWDDEVAKAFVGGAVDPGNPKAEKLRQARREFLESDIGIGIDIMAGGGTYEHSRNARQGYAVDGRVKERHPEYFRDDRIPHRFGGDALYDENGGYYGVVLSTFGICYNADRLNGMTDKRPPEKWAELGEPRFLNTLAVADPTQSGSANKCFEIILQQSMCEAGSPAAGWAPGLNLIKRIFANARKISDSASKVVRDVCEGDAVAGTAIDTYGISEEFWSAKIFGGKPHCFYVTPKGGTAVSADPVQLLRGAKNRRQAEEFIDFLLSEEGQKLHCFKAGAPGGPKVNSLNRPPVRKDLYTDANRKYFFKPGYDPYESGADFTYNPKWTGKYFNLLRVLFKSIAIDPHDELGEAWRAICAAGGPEKVPQAMAEFGWLPFDYSGAAEAAARLKSGKADELARLTRKWSDDARAHYKNAARLAREGK